MGSIHIMPSEIVGRIAAGEVVERPASVLKELVENSIDARATQIRINVENGGHRLVQVIDNGCGMDREDAMLCLETHATSKISSDGDVGRISTLGFRGEAIPSIASVSRFNLQTRRADEQVGTEIVVDFGKIRDQRDCGCAPGTNIRVGQLFANLPARRKFLRGPDTEDQYIEEMVRLLALARPDISFILCQNGRETIRANATEDLGTRVASVLGKEMFSAMLPVAYAEGGIAVKGFITKPGFTRSSRREQRVVVNGRVASAETVYFAIRESYENLVMKGRYPGAVLYIDIAPDRVDVNIHPTKREVRFREPREVGQVVSAAIRRALRMEAGGSEVDVVTSQPAAVPLPQRLPEHPQEFSFVPPVGLNENPSGQMDASGGSDDGQHGGQLPPQIHKAVPAPARAAVQMGLPMNLPPPTPPVPPSETNPPPVQIHSPQEEDRQPPLRNGLQKMHLIGRLGTKYALTEGEGGGLVVVNLRHAHQRVLFERLMKGMNASSVPQQQLLIPANLALGPDDARFLRSQLEHFRQLGFQVEPFGGTSFIVSAVPASFTNQDIGRMVRDIIDDLRRSTVTNRQSAIHLAQTAIRHAVSANESLSDEEIKSLISALARCDMPYACPNGHPTMVHITAAELDKRFLN